MEDGIIHRDAGELGGGKFWGGIGLDLEFYSGETGFEVPASQVLNS